MGFLSNGGKIVEAVLVSVEDREIKGYQGFVVGVSQTVIAFPGAKVECLGALDLSQAIAHHPRDPNMDDMNRGAPVTEPQQLFVFCQDSSRLLESSEITELNREVVPCDDPQLGLLEAVEEFAGLEVNLHPLGVPAECPIHSGPLHQRSSQEAELPCLSIQSFSLSQTEESFLVMAAVLIERSVETEHLGSQK